GAGLKLSPILCWQSSVWRSWFLVSTRHRQVSHFSAARSSRIMGDNMCGRFTLKQPRRINIINFDEADLPTLPPRYNIAPTQDVLAVVQRETNREARMLQWGLIPFWSKEPKGIINARVETIAEKASFNESFQKRRCLIFADGFYEWERSGKISQPYYFQLQD